MITAAEILSRTLTRNGAAPVTDDEIRTRCEWCEKELALSACEARKTEVGLMYRCPTCSDVLVIINRHADVQEIPKEPSPQSKDRAADTWNEEASAERAAQGTRVNGWQIRSTEDLIIGRLIVPRVPHGALRKFW